MGRIYHIRVFQNRHRDGDNISLSSRFLFYLGDGLFRENGRAFSQKKVSSKENERKGSKIGNKSRHVSDGVATLTFDNSCRKSWPVLRMKKCLNLCRKWHSLFLIFLSDVLAIGLFFFEALRAISRPLITKQKGKVAVYHRF